MDVGLIAYGAERNYLERLNLVANNIANVNTAGFKGDLAVHLPSVNAGSHKQSPLPLMRVALDSSQGALKETNRQLDVAIEGNGYFQVDTPLGPRFTRSGSFVVDSEGQIVTKEGYTLTGDGGALTLQPTDNVLKIGSNGEIYAMTETGPQLRGTIGIYKFSDPSGLQKVGNSYFTSSAGPENAVVNDDYKVAQGMLEDSNVNSMREMTEMIEINRNTEMLSKIISNNNTLLKDAVNRIAAKN